MRLNPYLAFDGHCEAAFRFYESCLGGELTLMRYGGSPMADQTPAGFHAKIMHARLVAGSAVLMGSDAPPGHFEAMRGIQVSLVIDDPAEAERAFAGLAEGAEIRMPLQETFWAQRFGMLTDRFGTPWMVNCERSA